MKVTVKQLTGEKTGVDLEESATVYDLKSEVFKALSIPHDQQKLSYESKRLEESEVLSSRGIADGVVVDLWVLSWIEAQGL